MVYRVLHIAKIALKEHRATLRIQVWILSQKPDKTVDIPNRNSQTEPIPPIAKSVRHSPHPGNNALLLLVWRPVSFSFCFLYFSFAPQTNARHRCSCIAKEVQITINMLWRFNFISPLFELQISVRTSDST